LVCSPTASGKTEAAVAPLIERNKGVWTDWTILYISPTRALVNDLYERLRIPLGVLGLHLARRTGDHHDDLGRVPNVLLTTPESFDSLMCRGRDLGGAPHVLTHVVAVVLDEAHLLHGTGRGEQARWLIERLRRLRRYAMDSEWVKHDGVQVVALSATVPDPHAVLDAYAVDGRFIRIDGGRVIQEVRVEGDLPIAEWVIPAVLSSPDPPSKVLVFANSRRRVDKRAEALRPLLDPLSYDVAGHHGSLDVKERERTERSIRTRGRMVVVSTSTLEIGVDIGDIDLVVLDAPPPDVSALLQRIGRGNRRTAETRVCLCAGSALEILIQEAMLTAARAGELGPGQVGPQFAVARQQIASFIFQSPKTFRSRDAVLDLVRSCLPDIDADMLLSHLVSEGDLTERNGQVALGTQWLDATPRGEIHSVIEGSPGQVVQDAETGDAIAHGIRFRGGKQLSIAAQSLTVRGWDDWRIQVRRDRGAGVADGQWSYVSRAWVEGPGQPFAVRQYLGVPRDQWPLVHVGGRTYVFHFGGARRAAVLRLAVAAAAEPGVSVTSWFLNFASTTNSPPGWLLQSTAASLELGLDAALERLEKQLGRPRANARLPRSLRLREVREWLLLAMELDAARQADWVECSDPSLITALRLLIGDVTAEGGTHAIT
jgi:ATP-dependent Lhr-like helicase